MQKTAKNITLLGTGWLGLPLLRALVADGHRVAGSGRQPERLRAITEAGGQAFAIDLPGPIPQAFLKECDCLIITLPPRGRQLGADAADQYLAALRSLPPLTHLSQLIYTSSTGVYGNQPGLVNEATPRQPATHSARAVAAAEDWLRANHPAVTILRLAGLIGPGRHPGNFFGGRSRAIPDGDAPVNLVHRQDVIAAIRLVLSEPSPGVFNVCAKAHPQKGTFYTAAARTLGLPIAGVQTGDGNGKIVISDRLRSHGWQPQYDKLLPLP